MPGWDQSKFDETLAHYMEVSKRTIRQIVNTKAYYVARGAVYFTQKSDASRIKGQLGQYVSVSAIGRKGKLVKRRQMTLTSGREHDAPLIALIINKRRGKQGLPGLYGKAMTKAVGRLLSARLRSVAFIKSGWLPAIKILAPLAEKRGAPPTDSTARQIGRPKGEAVPARLNWDTVAKIINLANARGDKTGALERVGGRGLQRAMDQETESMEEYMRARTKPDAEEFNRHQG